MGFRLPLDRPSANRSSLSGIMAIPSIFSEDELEHYCVGKVEDRAWNGVLRLP
jgi:hypothetical protein